MPLLTKTVLLLLLLSRFSRVRLCATPWTAAYQASLSMGFSRQEHWSGLPFPLLHSRFLIILFTLSFSLLQWKLHEGRDFCSFVHYAICTAWCIQVFHTSCGCFGWNAVAVVQSLSQSCLTLRNSLDSSISGFPILHHLPESAQTHVHWVSDAIQPSHPLSPPSPPALNLPQY